MPSNNVPVNKSLELLAEVFNTVDILGVEGTSNALSKARSEHMHFKDGFVEYVMNMVSTEMEIPVDTIINSNDKNAKRILCLKFISYYLYASKRFTYDHIALLIKKDKGMPWRYYNELKEFREDLKHVLQKHFRRFDKIVGEFKTAKK